MVYDTLCYPLTGLVVEVIGESTEDTLKYVSEGTDSVWGGYGPAGIKVTDGTTYWSIIEYRIKENADTLNYTPHRVLLIDTTVTPDDTFETWYSYDGDYPYPSGEDTVGKACITPRSSDTLWRYQYATITNYPSGGKKCDPPNIGPTAKVDEAGLTNNIKLTITPNPFTHEVKISYKRGGNLPVELVIFDVSGRKVFDTKLPINSHVFSWDGRDMGGKKVGSGIYFLHFKTTRGTLTRNIILL
jgi:hypothetical protein